MRIKWLLLAGALSWCLVAVGSALAHHGSAAFDTKNPVTVSGTVTDFEFVNPHSQIYFNVKNDKGETEAWQAEVTAPTKLARAGWNKHTFKVGDSITVTGAPAKSNKHSLWVQKLVGPDGQPVPLEVDEHGNPRYGPGE